MRSIVAHPLTPASVPKYQVSRLKTLKFGVDDKLRSEYYPYGTLEKQKPLFKQQGLDLEPFYSGTLNISVKPYIFQMIRPQYTFRKIAWTNLHPPEDFSFSACRVRFSQLYYPDWVYYPHPETKERNFQDPTLIEVIAMRIPPIQCGDTIEIELNPQEISVRLPQ